MSHGSQLLRIHELEKVLLNEKLRIIVQYSIV